MRTKQGVRLALRFGALTPSLAEQIPDLPKEELDHYQRDADAITRLAVRGVLSDGEKERARRRLFRKIEKELNALQAGE